MSADRESLVVVSSLTDDERRALASFQKTGLQSAFMFPAPSGCKSHEDWIREGDERWRGLRSKIFRSLPTAWFSPMLARRTS